VRAILLAMTVPFPATPEKPHKQTINNKDGVPWWNILEVSCVTMDHGENTKGTKKTFVPSVRFCG
jgi:hypothetical protein